MTKLIGTALQTWANSNKPDDDLIWKKGFWDQVNFARDILAPMFVGYGTLNRAADGKKYLSDAERDEPRVMVVGSHRSKSVTLPVVGMVAFDGRLQLVWRNNFHTQPLTILSSIPLHLDLQDRGLLGTEAQAIYCDGFPDGSVLPLYAPGCVGFTGEYQSTYDVYAVALMARTAMAMTLGKDPRM